VARPWLIYALVYGAAEVFEKPAEDARVNRADFKITVV
jgi:hypothetical protein